MVIHGTPSTVVSSCNPPESVKTIFAPRTAQSMSMYPTGSMVRTFSTDRPNSSIFARVLGWTGKMIGIRRPTSEITRQIGAKVSLRSTLDGR